MNEPTNKAPKNESLLRKLLIPGALAVTAVAALVAGADPGKADAAGAWDDQFGDYVSEAIQANRDAPTLADWENSGYTPSEIFQNAIDSRSVEARKALCRALDSLKPQDLALFGDELKAAKPELFDCGARLNQRVLNYWASRSKSLETALLALPRGGNGALVPHEERPFPPTEERHVDAAKGETLRRGGLKDKEICITLDDGPHETRSARILDALAERGVRVNYFNVGRRAALAPQLVRRAVEEGHVVGSHSKDHPDLRRMAIRQAEANILDGRRRVAEAAGVDVPFFRFPFGARTPVLEAFVKAQEMASFLWNMDSLDWKQRDPRALYEYAMSQVDLQKGGIILFHDVHEQTVIVLPQVLDELNRRGFQTVVFVPH